MPISKRDGKYYWGSKGPFNSRKKAEEVAQAAHASGYENSLLKIMKAPLYEYDETGDSAYDEDVIHTRPHTEKEAHEYLDLVERGEPTHPINHDRMLQRMAGKNYQINRYQSSPDEYDMTLEQYVDHFFNPQFRESQHGHPVGIELPKEYKYSTLLQGLTPSHASSFWTTVNNSAWQNLMNNVQTLAHHAELGARAYDQGQIDDSGVGGIEKALLKLMKAEGNHWSEDADGGWRVPHPENPFDNLDTTMLPTHPFQSGPRYNPSVLRMTHYATYEGDRNHKMTRLAGRTHLNEDPRAAGEIREGKLDPDLNSFHGFPHTPLQVEQNNFPVPWERSSSGPRVKGGTEEEHQLWLKAGPYGEQLYTHPQYAMGDIAGLKDKSMEELNADYPMAHKPVYANRWEKGQYAGGRENMPRHSGYHSVAHSAYPDTYQLEQAWPDDIRTRLNTPIDPTDNDSVSHELYRRYHPYQSDDDMRDIYRDGAKNFLRCIELGMHMTPGMYLAGLNSMTAHHNAEHSLIHPANPGLDLDRISASGYGVPDHTNYDADSSTEYTGIAPPRYRKGIKDWRAGDWNHPAILDQYGEPIGSPKPWIHPETHRMMYEVAVAPPDGNGGYHNQIGTPNRGLDYPAGMRFWSDFGGQNPNGYWGNASTQDSYGASDHPRYQKMPENPRDLLYLWPNEDPAAHLVHGTGRVPRSGRYSSYGPEAIEVHPSGDSRNRGIGRQFSSHESTYTPDAESYNRRIREGHNPQQFGREGYEAGRLVYNRHPSVIRGEDRDGELKDYDTEALHRGYTHVRPHHDKISEPRDTATGRLTNRRGAAREYDHRDGDIWSQGDVLRALNDFYGRMPFPEFQRLILDHGHGIRVHPDLHVGGKYLHNQLEHRLARTWDTAHLERPDRAPRRGSYDDE